MYKTKYIAILICALLWGSDIAAQSDIELEDSTSTEWGDGPGGGGLTPLEPNDPVTSLTLSHSKLTLEGGQRVRLVATVNPRAKDKRILWSSANPQIASVTDNGTVMGIGIGTTTITATAVGNTALKQTCQVTVTSDYEGMILPDVPFEFCYNAVDYDPTLHCIPNHFKARLTDAQLQLTENLPSVVADGAALRISDYCEGYIDRWDKWSNESGAYFYRGGEDCMTLVAKVAPRLNRGNASDFISNRGNGYNYMWRIGDNNASFLHTDIAYDDNRTLPLTSEDPQVLAVRVDGKNNYILLENLTTHEKRRIDGVNWGGGDNIFKFFYNDGGEFFLGDFYWAYYSFELLTDAQLAYFDENFVKGDANNDGKVTITDAVYVVNYVLQQPAADFHVKAADVNGDGNISITDAVMIVNIILGQTQAP